MAYFLLMCAAVVGLLLSVSCCCFGGLGDDEIVDYAGGPRNWHNEGSAGDA